MKRNSFQKENVGCNIISNNTSDRFKSYSISWAFSLLFYVTRDWLKKLSVMRDLIEKFCVMCNWNTPPPFATLSPGLIDLTLSPLLTSELIKLILSRTYGCKYLHSSTFLDQFLKSCIRGTSPCFKWSAEVQYVEPLLIKPGLSSLPERSTVE